MSMKQQQMKSMLASKRERHNNRMSVTSAHDNLTSFRRQPALDPVDQSVAKAQEAALAGASIKEITKRMAESMVTTAKVEPPMSKAQKKEQMKKEEVQENQNLVNSLTKAFKTQFIAPQPNKIDFEAILDSTNSE